MIASEYIKKLDSVFGVSGNEYEISSVVSQLFSKFCDSVEIDGIGNVIGRKKGTNPDAPSIMVEAHMDELGLMVSRITDEGSLNFITVGGFDPKVLPGTEVTIHGKQKLFGVIGAMPPHLIVDRSKASKINELCVDTGYSKEEIEKLVSVGDIITINTYYTELLNNFVAGRCIDDRGGLAAILRMLELLENKEIENEIIVVATVQEELGLRGARVAASHIMPGCAIAIDVCHGESANVRDDAFPCGKGPVITVGPNLHSKFTKKIIEQAKKNGIEIQLEACEGDTGTDAWEIQTASCGVPTALLSIPLRYMHSNYEIVNTNDIEATAKLIAFTVMEIKDGECLCF